VKMPSRWLQPAVPGRRRPGHPTDVAAGLPAPWGPAGAAPSGRSRPVRL